MRRLLLIIGTCLTAWALALLTDLAVFLSRSERVEATVAHSDYYRGPPRSPRATVLTLKFRDSTGAEHSATTHAPFLRPLAAGDGVPLLIDRLAPDQVRWPFLPELLSWPLSLMVFGLGLLVGGKFVPSRTGGFSA